MASEARVTSVLQIVKGNLTYNSLPGSFVADVSGTFGPHPGAVTVSPYGTIIDLSSFTQPGLCRIMNLDDTNQVEYGIYDPQFSRFFPLGEMLPGESFVIRFSRNIQEGYVGTGTGTAAEGESNRLFFKAWSAPVVVLIEAFES